MFAEFGNQALKKKHGLALRQLPQDYKQLISAIPSQGAIRAWFTMLYLWTKFCRLDAFCPYSKIGRKTREKGDDFRQKILFYRQQ